MTSTAIEHCLSSFQGHHLIASGQPAEVALATRGVIDAGSDEPVLVFNDTTGEQIELDLRGTAEEISTRYQEADAAQPPAAPRRPGRPKLGVVAREVTLLPRHWEWLSTQPGGASVALRKLVEQARRDNAANDRVRQAREAAYRFMSAMAGNLPGFEEASRALFASDAPRFAELTQSWPPDVRDHCMKLAAPAFDR
ncbi:MAG TPA: DUF2239 family protein [Tepidisphaeraceae bacterium]|nr:DUF2239 family protein [Tepidisphaeraceae bacterium]